MIEKIRTKNSFQEILVIIIIAIFFSFVYNIFSPKSIPLFHKIDEVEYVSDKDLFQYKGGDSVKQKNISTKQMIELVENRKAIIIDARNADSYQKGHIPNAINIPFLDVFNYMDKLQYIPRDTLIIVYCEGINCELSQHLSEFMKGMNFTRIFHYPGGYEEWINNNLRIEKIH